MRSYRWLPTAFALFLVACGRTGDDVSDSQTTQPAAGPSGSVGAAGGTIASEDGGLRLEIPPDVLGEDTLIEVSAVPAADLGLDETVVIGSVYDLLPDGQTFSEPVTVVRTFDAAALGLSGGEVPFLIILHEQPESWDLLDSTTARTGDVVEVSSEITHFTGNAVIDVQQLGPFGDEVRLTMTPASFAAEIGSGPDVHVTADVPSIVDRSLIDVSLNWVLDPVLVGDLGPTGGRVTCDTAGTGEYIALLDLRIDLDAMNRIPAPRILISATTPETFLRTVGQATCTGPEGEAASVTGLAGIDFLSGELTFDSILDDLTYTDRFTLEYVPADSPEVPFDPLRSTASLWIEAWAASLGVEGPTPDTAVLTQVRPGGQDQQSFGRAVNLPDGSQQVITAGLGQTHLEIYSLNLTPRPGFPGSSQRVTARGFTLGGPTDLDIEQAFADAVALAQEFIDDLERLDLPADRYQWVFRINGELMVDQPVVPGGDGAADVDSEISAIDSGLFEDELWIRILFPEPIPDSSEQFVKRYNVFISSDQDDLFGASWTVRQGSVPFASSFCLPNTPNCPPDGIVPVLGVPGDTLMDLTFFFPDDAFGDATGLKFRVSVQTGQTDAPEDLVTVDFMGGEQFPLRTDERDPG